MKAQSKTEDPNAGKKQNRRTPPPVRDWNLALAAETMQSDVGRSRRTERREARHPPPRLPIITFLIRGSATPPYNPALDPSVKLGARIAPTASFHPRPDSSHTPAAADRYNVLAQQSRNQRWRRSVTGDSPVADWRYSAVPPHRCFRGIIACRDEVYRQQHDGMEHAAYPPGRGLALPQGIRAANSCALRGCASESRPPWCRARRNSPCGRVRCFPPPREASRGGCPDRTTRKVS